jgi:DNA invertase Pin-like site-specific DNA recombinase
MNVYCYLRVSGISQIDGDGFERQWEKIQLFCANNGLHVRGSFKDGGVSGTTDGLDRPEFSEMMGYCDKQEIKAIVVERMDRIARDLMVSEVLLGECRKRGIKVFAADQGSLIDMAADGVGVDPTRVLIRQIMGALAQWERSMLVNKLKSARDRIKASGKRCEGRKPFGSHPEEIATLRAIEIFQGACSDTINFRHLAERLNEEGFTQRNKKPWTRQAVRQVIERKKNGPSV